MTYDRKDALSRKLALFLGSKTDWMPIYEGWCAENQVSTTSRYDDHHVRLFVKQQKNKALSGRATLATQAVMLMTVGLLAAYAYDPIAPAYNATTVHIKHIVEYQPVSATEPSSAFTRELVKMSALQPAPIKTIKGMKIPAPIHSTRLAAR